MIDDFSAIPTSGCNVLTSATALSNYNNGIRYDFVNISGKWVKTRESTYNSIPFGYVCNNLDFTSYTYLEPFYQLSVIVMVVFVIYCVFKLFSNLFTRGWRL